MALPCGGAPPPTAAPTSSYRGAIRPRHSPQIAARKKGWSTLKKRLSALSQSLHIHQMSGRQYPMATMHSATSVEDFDVVDTDILLGRTEEPVYPWQRWYKDQQPKSKKPLFIVGAILALLFLASAMYKTGAYMAADKKSAMSSVAEERITNRLSALNGPPTRNFRGLCASILTLRTRGSYTALFLADNLKPNLRYISSWIDAGWSTSIPHVTRFRQINLILISKRCYYLRKSFHVIAVVPSQPFV